MKLTNIHLVTITVMGLSATVAQADRVGGAPKADFNTNQLSIPCVQISNLSDQTEGKYFDIVLVRRGNSYNYELSAAELEDSSICERIADFARFEDDDFTDEREGSVGNSDDSEDDDRGDDSNRGNTGILRQAALAQCEVRTDRSRISVKGKGVGDGSFFAVVTSGTNSIQSLVRASAFNEVEFDFDSESGNVMAGADAIELDFIQGNTVTAEIFRDGEAVALLSDNANCRVKR